MGCVQATAKRRRRQARANQSQLSRKERPYYKRSDAESSKKRLERVIMREREMKQRKGASKK